MNTNTPTLNRRGFLAGMLALGAAPAIVRAESLMRVVPLDKVLDCEVGKGWLVYEDLGSAVVNTRALRFFATFDYDAYEKRMRLVTTESGVLVPSISLGRARA